MSLPNNRHIAVCQKMTLTTEAIIALIALFVACVSGIRFLISHCGAHRILICWEILAFSIMLFQHEAGIIIGIEGNPISCRCNSSLAHNLPGGAKPHRKCGDCVNRVSYHQFYQHQCTIFQPIKSV
ncbi:hypothetical protein F9C07_2144472 [Aspergillus flavus]|uniref:Uncharacterized protein n=1 Tax=Aspergillus flavus (strain ATCC 200026 / FGSC A1120 / IAM 13836 / NRRL 3357 / JCM 12722 / SRRC 167) TaxID=332952 RepID=A0A7U2MX16_ASPFN|nr:hypothetical protein F9C07_2144472 [Aspergillus flavus]